MLHWQFAERRRPVWPLRLARVAIGGFAIEDCEIDRHEIDGDIRVPGGAVWIRIVWSCWIRKPLDEHRAEVRIAPAGEKVVRKGAAVAVERKVDERRVRVAVERAVRIVNVGGRVLFSGAAIVRCSAKRFGHVQPDARCPHTRPSCVPVGPRGWRIHGQPGRRGFRAVIGRRERVARTAADVAGNDERVGLTLEVVRADRRIADGRRAAVERDLLLRGDAPFLAARTALDAADRCDGAGTDDEVATRAYPRIRQGSVAPVERVGADRSRTRLRWLLRTEPDVTVDGDGFGKEPRCGARGQQLCVRVCRDFLKDVVGGLQGAICGKRQPPDGLGAARGHAADVKIPGVLIGVVGVEFTRQVRQVGIASAEQFEKQRTLRNAYLIEIHIVRIGVVVGVLRIRVRFGAVCYISVVNLLVFVHEVGSLFPAGVAFRVGGAAVVEGEGLGDHQVGVLAAPDHILIARRGARRGLVAKRGHDCVGVKEIDHVYRPLRERLLVCIPLKRRVAIAATVERGIDGDRRRGSVVVGLHSEEPQGVRRAAAGERCSEGVKQVEDVPREHLPRPQKRLGSPRLGGHPRGKTAASEEPSGVAVRVGVRRRIIVARFTRLIDDPVGVVVASVAQRAVDVHLQAGDEVGVVLTGIGTEIGPGDDCGSVPRVGGEQRAIRRKRVARAGSRECDRERPWREHGGIVAIEGPQEPLKLGSGEWLVHRGCRRPGLDRAVCQPAPREIELIRIIGRLLHGERRSTAGVVGVPAVIDADRQSRPHIGRRPEKNAVVGGTRPEVGGDPAVGPGIAVGGRAAVVVVRDSGKRGRSSGLHAVAVPADERIDFPSDTVLRGGHAAHSKQKSLLKRAPDHRVEPHIRGAEAEAAAEPCGFLWIDRAVGVLAAGCEGRIVRHRRLVGVHDTAMGVERQAAAKVDTVHGEQRLDQRAVVHRQHAGAKVEPDAVPDSVAVVVDVACLVGQCSREAGQ